MAGQKGYDYCGNYHYFGIGLRMPDFIVFFSPLERALPCPRLQAVGVECGKCPKKPASAGLLDLASATLPDFFQSSVIDLQGRNVPSVRLKPGTREAALKRADMAQNPGNPPAEAGGK